MVATGSHNSASIIIIIIITYNSGEFGIVYKGYLAGQHIGETVAIKTLKGSYSIQFYCQNIKDVFFDIK